MLKGKRIDLRRVEREDLELVGQWENDPDMTGEFDFFPVQASRAALEKEYLEPRDGARDSGFFMVQKKDGTGIGTIAHFLVGRHRWMEIGYHLVPTERGKGFGTEAIALMVDYLFLTREITRVQALTDLDNKASRGALETVGFRLEGTIRNSTFVRGRWVDDGLYGITRDEWKGPRVLAPVGPTGPS